MNLKKIIYQKLQWIHQLFVEDNESHIHSVFNCKDLIYISDMIRNRITPDETELKFVLVFSNVRFWFSTTKDYQSLADLRELFINNIGFSYVQLAKPMLENISIIREY